MDQAAPPSRDQLLHALRRADIGDADALYTATARAVKHGLASEALPRLTAGVKRHRDDSRLWQILGLAHRRCEDMEPAVAAFVRAAKGRPDDPLIAHSLARSRLEAGLPAASAFQRAWRMAPNDASVILGYAAALYAENRIADAIGSLDKVLGDNPGWTAGHETVSRLRWLCGDREGFTVSYRRALAAIPRVIPLWRGLINAHIDAGQLDRVPAIIAEARSAAGDSPVFDALAAVCAGERGETERADMLFAGLGGLEHITIVVRHVRHLLRAGRPEAAAEAAEARIADDNGHLLWPYLATCWRLTGDPRREWLEGDPRLVGVYDIGDKLGSLDALAERLRALHLATDQPLEQSLRGGTQTDGPLFARIEPEIRELRKIVQETVERHVAQLPPVDPTHPVLAEMRSPIRFSGSWSVRLTDRGHHIDHVHPAGWISSAFYVALPEDGMGGANNAGYLKLGALEELVPGLEPFRLIEPKPGRLVLFPSIMWHGTLPFAAGERLTVAFDVARPGR